MFLHPFDFLDWEEVPKRERRIGGGDIGALVGHGISGKKPIDVFKRIVLREDGFFSPYMKRGLDAEPEVRRRFLEATGLTLEPHPGITTFEDWGVASVDDLLSDDSVVDYKTASNMATTMKKWGPNFGGPEDLPSGYHEQLALYMAVHNRSKARLFVAFGTDEKDEQGKLTGEFTITETRLYEIARDPAFEAALLEAGRKFHREHIATKIPPVVLTVKRQEAAPVSPEEKALLEFLDPTPAPPTPPPTPKIVLCLCSICGLELAQGTACPNTAKHPLYATSDTAAPDILPPDAPKSDPELASACPHCPPGSKNFQHKLADCPTLHPAPVKEKRKRKSIVQPGETASATDQRPVPPAETPSITATPARTALQIYVDCQPGPGVTPQPLEPYIQAAVHGLAASEGGTDIRASDSKRFGYGKWKGVLATFARTCPPEPGCYTISVRYSEFNAIVVEALAPLCAPGFPVRGS